MTFNQVWDVLAEERAEGYEEGLEKGIEKGLEKGIEKGAREVIVSLIHHLPDANDETIANLSSKPVEYVAQVRREMK
ncbi:MAG: hypothetical protein IAE84_08325 [Saprospiraceae bacterium]|nr:hypothetical protein [Saprospiraceae bacterium]